VSARLTTNRSPKPNMTSRAPETYDREHHANLNMVSLLALLHVYPFSLWAVLHFSYLILHYRHLNQPPDLFRRRDGWRVI
jgi:hypothetical protein